MSIGFAMFFYVSSKCLYYKDKNGLLYKTILKIATPSLRNIPAATIAPIKIHHTIYKSFNPA